MHRGKSTGRLIVLVLALAAVVALGVNCTVQKPSAEEKQVMVTVGDFEKYGFGPSASPDAFERFTKVSILSTHMILQYYYEPPESDDSIKYLYEMLQVREKPAALDENKSLQESMVKNVFSSQKISLREEKTGFAYGKRNKVFSILTEEGVPVGSYITIGDERLDCVFMSVGVVVNEKEVLEELFRSKLDAAKELAVR
ncbi:MAG: hypothetical protein JXD23_10330 [Spirochaetales bacterium]|nr:hypothetical protein [Spirochaetales bacterium]